MKPTTEDYLNFARMLVDSHHQELAEIRDELGATNVDDFYFNSHSGSWILTFKKGEDQEFDTKDEMIEWVKAEAVQP